jgi:thiosulfate/3-mercaptopyruvate sulfurtransferase
MQREIITLVLAVLGSAIAADDALVQPKDLAAQLQAKGPKPSILYVGFAVMYRSKHIPGAAFAGPGSRDQGLDELKKATGGLPRDRDIVIYCGCCPYEQCPNIKPAIALLKKMGFSRVRTLMIPTNFASDWVDHGYPVQADKPEAK